MRDHAYYDELVVLATGGHLSRDEQDELRDHLTTCPECRQNARSYEDLVTVGLPMVHESTSANGFMTGEAPAGARERFLERARREGVGLSTQVDVPAGATRWTSSRVIASLAVAAAIILALIVPTPLRRTAAGTGGAQALDGVRAENAQLSDRLQAREQELATQQGRLTELQAQLAAAAKNTNVTARPQVPGFPLGQSVSQEARLLEELQNRDKQLAAAAEEISRINQLRVTDRAALDAQKVRVKEAFDQLRIANATIDMERQLADTGRDLLQLMLAKQLRVVDVRDTDANGRPSPAFARVFVADGRSIRIFAFDLNEDGTAAPRRFQVWGEQLGDPQSARSLGVLNVDDRIQNRWSLTIQNADVVKGINSVFVTTAARGTAAEGPRQLYALLGN